MPPAISSSASPAFVRATGLGLVYVGASLALLVWILPALWTSEQSLETTRDEFFQLQFGLVMVVASLAVLLGGVRLLARARVKGLGIAVAAACLMALSAVVVTAYAGATLENRGISPVTGIPVTIALLIAQVVLIVRLIAGASWQRTMVEVSQDRFPLPYSPRGRLALTLGIAALTGGAVTATYLAAPGESAHWTLSVPYTGHVIVTVSGESCFHVGRVLPRAVVEAKNEELRNERLRILDPGDSFFDKTDVARRDEVEQVSRDMIARGLKPPVAVVPRLAAYEAYPSITILPYVRYTLPAILIALCAWLTYRVLTYTPVIEVPVAMSLAQERNGVVEEALVPEVAPHRWNR